MDYLIVQPSKPPNPNLREEHVMKKEPVNYVEGRVVVADYSQIKKDFSNVYFKGSPLATTSNEIINEWLIYNACILTSRNIASSLYVPEPTTDEVLRPTIVSHKRPLAYRPPNYGRAVVIDVTGEYTNKMGTSEDLSTIKGLIDIKGVGMNPVWKYNRKTRLYKKMDRGPKPHAYQTGTMSLKNAVYEFFIEQIVRIILTHSKYMIMNGVDTIRSYAVIDLGLYVKESDEVYRAGLYLRQPHVRSLNEQGEIVNLQTSKKIQSEFAWYGISTFHYENIRDKRTLEVILDVQATNDIADISTTFEKYIDNTRHNTFKYSPGHMIYIFDFTHYSIIGKQLTELILGERFVPFISTTWNNCNIIPVNIEPNKDTIMHQARETTLHHIDRLIKSSFIKEKDRSVMFTIINFKNLQKYALGYSRTMFYDIINSEKQETVESQSNMFKILNQVYNKVHISSDQCNTGVTNECCKEYKYYIEYDDYFTSIGL
jgi:hypothetical protein